jgi:Flp pilus assembly protein TadG
MRPGNDDGGAIVRFQNLMKSKQRGKFVPGRRRGMAIVYIAVTVVAMMGICSMAVDFGRVVTAKTELGRAAEAAARAAVYSMSTGASNSSILSAAAAVAAQNTVDGTTLTLSTGNASTDIQVGLWNTTTKAFTANSTPLASANNTNTFPAVKIWAKRTSANGNPISLVFGQVVGASTCDVNATAVAELYPAASQSYNGTGATDQLHSTSNPWLAGVQSTDDTTAYYNPPSGVTNGKTGTASAPDTAYPSTTNHYWKFDVANPAGYGQTMGTKEFSTDNQTGQPYGSPMQVGSSAGGAVNGVNTIAISPGGVLQISNVTQAGSANVNNDFTSSDNFNADGYDGSYSSDSNTDSPTNAGLGAGGSPENGISNIYVPKCSIIGVFLNDNDPVSDGGVSAGNPTGTAPTPLDFSGQTARDYTNIEPQLRQTFFVGDGTTSSGVQQSIIVPVGATRFYLATMDGHEWSNNSGGFDFSINEYKIVIVQ